MAAILSVITAVVKWIPHWSLGKVPSDPSHSWFDPSKPWAWDCTLLNSLLLIYLPPISTLLPSLHSGTPRQWWPSAEVEASYLNNTAQSPSSLMLCQLCCPQPTFAVFFRLLLMSQAWWEAAAGYARPFFWGCMHASPNGAWPSCELPEGVRSVQKHIRRLFTIWKREYVASGRRSSTASRHLA